MNDDHAAFEVWFEAYREARWRNSGNVDRGPNPTEDFMMGYKRMMGIAFEAGRIDQRLCATISPPKGEP